MLRDIESIIQDIEETSELLDEDKKEILELLKEAASKKTIPRAS